MTEMMLLGLSMGESKDKLRGSGTLTGEMVMTETKKQYDMHTGTSSLWLGHASCARHTTLSPLSHDAQHSVYLLLTHAIRCFIRGLCLSRTTTSSL